MKRDFWRNIKPSFTRPISAWPLALLLSACGGSDSPTGAAPSVLAPALETVAPQASVQQSGESASSTTAIPAAASQYSIVNLGSDGDMAAVINNRGQVLVGTYAGGGINAFFDGERLHEIGSLGGGYTLAWDLNNDGVVVGEGLDDSAPYGALRAFTWSVTQGMRALPGDSAQGRAINDGGQVAGSSAVDGLSAQATRWSRSGGLNLLGPRPESLSQVYAINRSGAATGFADVAGGAIHAVVWDADGRQTDLGAMDGSNANGQLINARGQVAGLAGSADGTRVQTFFWNASDGLIPIGAEGGGVRLLAALNDRGEVAGNAQSGDLSLPYWWSRQRGLTPLPLGGEQQGDVFDMNKDAAMVGSVQTGFDWRTRRAVLWPGVSAPVDLNARLLRVPTGLRLYAGAAINADGAILAHSNAGLVLLKPDKKGTNAPVLGPVRGLPDALAVGDTVALKLAFTDNAARETHTVTVDAGDGCATTKPVVVEANGAGEASFTHIFCTFGFQMLSVRVTDSGGRSTLLRQEVFVDDPQAASVSGRGTLPAAAGAKQPLQFKLWTSGAGVSDTARASLPASFVELAGPLHFKTSAVTNVQRDGALMRLSGVGSLNGRAGYRVEVEAMDGAGKGADRLRVRISHRDGATKAEVVDYDSALPAAMGTSRAASGIASAAAAPVAARLPALVRGAISMRH